jgi:16S rRNA processing protein RimM
VVPPRTSAPRICVAQIGAPHGVRGEVRIKSFTADPMALAEYGALTSEDGARSFEITALRPGNEVLVARLKGVADRNAAERLRNLRLYVPRDRLPNADEDEFYHADLIGLAAVQPNGAVIGTVAALHNFGAGDLIEITPQTGGPSLLLPFTKAVVPEIDVAAGRIIIVAPEETPDEPSPLVGEGGEPRRGEPGEGSREEPHTRPAPLGTLSHKGRGK